MDLMQLGGQLMKQFADKNNDGQVDMMEAMATLSRVFGSGGAASVGTSAASLDMGGLLNKMQGSGLSDIVSSWLGDGDNEAISSDQIGEMLGKDKIEEYAASMNIDAKTAQDQLAEVVPVVVDKSSQGGQLGDLLSAVGGIEGLSKMFAAK